MTTTPALEQFSGAYLHEDWFDEYGTVWGALEDFVRGEPELARDLPGEVARTLASRPSEAELDRRFAELGSCFTPLPEEGGYVAWLTEVANRVNALLAA